MTEPEKERYWALLDISQRCWSLIDGLIEVTGGNLPEKYEAEAEALREEIEELMLDERINT